MPAQVRWQDSACKLRYISNGSVYRAGRASADLARSRVYRRSDVFLERQCRLKVGRNTRHAKCSISQMAALVAQGWRPQTPPKGRWQDSCCAEGVDPDWARMRLCQRRIGGKTRHANVGISRMAAPVAQDGRPQTWRAVGYTAEGSVARFDMRSVVLLECQCRRRVGGNI